MVNLIIIFLILILNQNCIAEMKGWEIYCVVKKNEVKYLLTLGTNRLKEENEIVNHKGLVTFSELTKKLKTLPKNEHVIIEGGGLKDVASRLILPPEKDEKVILSICRENKLICVLTEQVGSFLWL